MKTTRLSALIVNYNTGAFALGCARSLVQVWGLEGRRREDLELVLVDNASPEPEPDALEALRELGATVITSDENLGYSGGMNRALRETSGGPEDVLAILNPDLCFLPGSVAVLLDYLSSHPGCGAVAPRTSIDPGGELLLSRDLLPTPLEHVRTTLARMSPFFCRAYGRRRLRLALEWWTSEGPLETDMVTGCCLFLRRAVLERLDTLLDERFPLYFEDTDLYRRLGGLGLSVVRHGGAHVVHHWSRSAKVGEGLGGEVLRRYHVSCEQYFKKHYGALGWRFVRGLTRLEQKWPAAKLHRAMHAIEDLGAFTEALELKLPYACRYVLELGLAPTWIITVGILGQGDRWQPTCGSWEWFFEADYFVRGFDRDSGAFLGAWHFIKHGPGRAHPLELAEIAQLGQRAPLPG